MRQTVAITERDEKHYIESIINGKTECFAFFVERYSHPIYSLIVQIVGCSEDAEELVQDVFLKAFRSLESYSGECRFLTWIYRIAYNTAISATRKRKHEFLYFDDSSINRVSDTLADTLLDDAVADGEKINDLMLAIDKLLPEEKALITLFYLEEKSIVEASHITGITVANVKVRLHRIRKKLYLLMTNGDDKKGVEK